MLIYDVERENMRPFLNGRPPNPDDVSNLLCGPIGIEDQTKNIHEAFLRARNEFSGMIERILFQKENDERDMQRGNTILNPSSEHVGGATDPSVYISLL
ncbi:Retrovirus-related Pol polyprotein from type-1 retrotransposable element R1 4 [Aphis craccivora]|uniref:Retrovirus-related Pol polyprotein from type-1 retrotransposable element R1 4 n=1 Tax=Aphis craccivora TaxID=307492 RepID=A0A6G0YSA6_APHCR|nr:Retrovirus-related Pol polyprotein from type-1 retrotransposable element R1 4 [Aphis craccivora]